MLRFDWLSHLKTRRPKRRRKTGRKAIRNSAELLQIRTMLSANPIATVSEDETGDDDDHADDDHTGDDEGGSELEQLIGELRELSESELQSRVEAFEPDDEGAVDLLDELSEIRELDDEELDEELGQLEEEEREELTEILRGLGLGDGPADDDEDDESDEEDGDEPEEDGDEGEEPGGEDEDGDEDDDSDEEDTDEDETDGEDSDEDGETDDEDSDSEDAELGQLISDLRALSDSELQARVEAFEVDAQGAADLLEELRMIRELDDEQLETELAELEPIERAELAEVLRGLGLGESGDEEDNEDDGTDEEDHDGEETGGDGGPDDHDHGDDDHEHDGDSDDTGGDMGDTGGDHDHGDHDDTSCGAHADNPVLAGEHCAAMALATPEAASHTLIASGDWSDTSVWQNGVAPTDNADVYIPAGMTLTVDGVIGETLHTIRIDGTLRFATDVNTQLKVDTIVGAPGSLLEIGTEANPIADDVTVRIIFADGGEIDRTWDPSQISRGAILHGQTVMFGTEKTAWTTLAEPARAGDSTLTLREVPVGWKVGDELVIAGTDPNDVASDGIVTIASIGGTTVTLNQPLARDHVAPASDLSVHVANNTRNIQLSSENPELMRRGHVMFMHTLNVDVNYAGFYQLGRTDKSRPVDDYSFSDLDATQISYGPANNVRGRYSVHFHRGGTDPSQTPARVRGAVVAGNPGWGYVNHSANVDFISNIAYDVTGAAYNNEAGDELGSYVGNIALRVVNPNDPLNSDEEFDADAREAAQDFGFQGDGFWLQGAGTRLENNVVAGNSGTAFFYWPEGLLEPGLGMMQINAAHLPNGELLAGREDQTINTWWNPVAGFQNNTAYNVGVGLEVIYLHTTYLNGDDDMPQEYVDQLHSTFDGLTVWNARGQGMKVSYTERVTFNNIRLHGVGEEDSVGIAANHYQNQKTMRFENLIVDGFGIGMETPPQGDITISGDFSNLLDFYIENPQRTARTMEFSDITFSDPTGFDEIIERRNFQLQANFEVNDDKHSAFFLLPDRILLNFGEFSGQALYFNEQHPDFVPMPSQPEDSESVVIAPEFLGKTNKQLLDEFGLSFGGALLPGDATADSELGLGNAQIGSAADPPTTFPPGGFPEDEEDEEFPDDEDPDDEEDGDEEPGDEEDGDEEPGDEEDGDAEPGDEEDGDEEPGDDEDGDEEPGDDEDGDEEPGDDEDGDEEPGDDEDGDEEPGDDEDGGEEPGDEEDGDDEPGDDEDDDEEPADDEDGDDSGGETSFEITPLPADAPAGLSEVFSKQIDVFGIKVYATTLTLNSDVLHAATVLAEYLDNNEDGEVDNPAVLEAMLESEAGMVMFATRAESDAAQEEHGELLFESGFGFQDLNGEETRPGGAADGEFDAALEEVLHLVTVYGYAKAYPAAFAFQETSLLTQAMDVARGGHFEEVPSEYPDGAWYTYDDETCDYGCMAVEYFYWGLTSILGGQDFDGRLEQIDNEWRLNTRDKVEETDSALFALLTDSQYKLPTTLPNGIYKATIDDGEMPEDDDASDEGSGDEGPGDESPNSVTVALPGGDSGVTIEEGFLIVAQGGEVVSETSLDGVSTLTLTGTSDAEAIILDLRNGTDLNLESISVLAGDGDDTVTFLGAGSAEVMIAGEGGDDLLIGSSSDEKIAGGDGNDTMIGGAGRDELSGGAGNDVLIGNGGHDTLDGGEGDDFARGDSGHDDITAGSGADVLLGRAGNDTLRFSPGIDSADGGAGNNVMLEDSTSSDAAPEIGGTNVEITVSDTGEPVALTLRNGSLVVSQDGTVQRRIMLDATETLTITGSAGDDEINIDFSKPGAIQLTSLTINGQAGNDEISIESLAATLTDSVLASGGLGDDVITLNRDIRQAVTADGGAGHDSITTARGRDIIRGGDGNDFIDGGAQRDFIKGDRGHDRIFGRGGSDRIYGGSGFDTINGNGGNDLILGNSGDDFLKGSSGNDRILGHGGNDVLRGDAGDDILQAGDGQDVLLGNAGNDGLSAGAGNDLVFGHSGNDSLAGGEGDDTCSGHSGDDIVMGQAGDDLITGHGGNDILTGGDGTDEVTGSESEIDEDFTFLADWIDTV